MDQWEWWKDVLDKFSLKRSNIIESTSRQGIDFPLNKWRQGTWKQDKHNRLHHMEHNRTLKKYSVWSHFLTSRQKIRQN